MDIITEIILQIRKGWYPQSNGDIYISAIFVFLFLILLLLILKKLFAFEYSRRFLIIMICIVISIFYIHFQKYVRPKADIFLNEEIGIAVMKFAGADLYDNFGFEGIERRIVSDLNQSNKMLGLSEWIKARQFSYKVASSDYAKEILSKYNAKGVMWGTVSKLDSVVSISLNMTYATWGFGLETPVSRLKPFFVELERMGPFYISLFGSEFNADLNALYNNIYIDILPYLSMFLLEQKPQFFNSIFDSINQMEQYDSLNPLGPYYLFMAAQAEQISQKPTEAINKYQRSYELCCRLSIDNDSNWMSSFNEKAKYQTLAAACKFEEGIIRLCLGDSLDAINLILYSTLLDSSFYKEGLRIASSLEKKAESEYTFKIPPCFAYFKASTKEDSLSQYYKIVISKKPSK